MKKKIITLDPITKILTIDGKTFRQKEEVIGRDDHLKHMIFEEFDKKKYDATLEYIAEKLEQKVNRKFLVKDALKDLDTSKIEKIKKRLQKGARVRQKYGCYNIRVGGIEIPIRE